MEYPTPRELPTLPVVNTIPPPSTSSVADAANFTYRAGEFLLSPKYSLLINGIKLIAGDKNQGYLSGFGTFIGALMITSSPVWGVVRLAVGVPGVVVGAIGTAVSGILYAIGLGVPTPSRADTQREALTRQFVARMQDVMKGMSYPQAHYFREHPNQLISIAFITVAFLSRKEGDNRLKAGGQTLRWEDISEQDATRKAYFEGISYMKMAIQSLGLGDDDDEAWAKLLGFIQTPPEDLVGRDTIEILTSTSAGMSEVLVGDKVFIRVWEEMR
jgi:hypothetical protein